MKNWFKRLCGTMKQRGGYSLVELSVSTSIIALLAVGGLAVMQKKTNSDKVRETLEKIEVIEDTLKGFVRVKGYLPCPALPALQESDVNFGKSINMTIAGAITQATIYDDNNDANPTGTDRCSNNGLQNETGMIPVRTLNMADEYAYDGWGRKFTFRTASISGSAEDFSDTSFRGNIRVVDLEGTNKTNIDNPAPYDDGAIYVIISHGENARRVAWRRNFDYAANPGEEPVSATGVERQNSVHTRKTYIQDDKTEKFDDIVAFGVTRVFVPPKIVEAPVKIDEATCVSALAIHDDPDILDTYESEDSTKAKSIENISKRIAHLCRHAPSSLKNYESPAEISGITVWLDASDPFDNSYVPADGTTMGASGTEWIDKSGNGNDATAPNGSRPSLALNAINGLPVIRFDGSSHYLTLGTEDVNQATEVTIFAVVSAATGSLPNSTAIYHRSIFSTRGISGAFNSNTWEIEFAGISSTQNQYFGITQDTTHLSTAQGSVAEDTPTLINYIREGTSHLVYINGTKTSLPAITTDFDSGNISQKVIGRGRASNGDVHWQGDIGELVIFDVGLREDSKKQKALQNYLLTKWGIASTAGAATNNCPYPGQIADATGNCHCDEGYELQFSLQSTNACVNSETNNQFGECAPINSAPDYHSDGHTPPSLSRLQLWLDANDCTTIELLPQDAADGTRRVTKWSDKSPNGFDFVNPATLSDTLAIKNNMPTYKDDHENTMFNGFPTIVFDTSSGKTQYLKESTTSTLDLSGIGGMSVFAVIKPPVSANVTSRQTIIGRGSAAAGLGWELGIFEPGTPSGLARTSLAVSQSGSPSFAEVFSQQVLTNAPYMLTAIYDNGVSTGTSPSISMHIDGQLDSIPVDASNFSGKTVSSIGQDAYIGAAYNGTSRSNHFSGEIGEILVYDETKTDVQIDQIIDEYFSNKWNITLGADAPAPGGVEPVLWLDASDVNTMFSDYTSCNALAAASENVACWKSKRGNHYFKRLSSSSGGPQRFTTAPDPDGTGNTTSVLNFYDDTHSLHLTDELGGTNFDFSTDFTVVAVLASMDTSGGAEPRYFFSRNHATGIGNILSNGYTFGSSRFSRNIEFSFFDDYATGVLPDNFETLQSIPSEPVFPSTHGKLVMLTIKTEGTSQDGNAAQKLSIYKNSQALTPIFTDSTRDSQKGGIGADGSINIGHKYSDGNYSPSAWKGYIGELLAYNSALNDTDRTAVETEIRSKWGFPATTPTDQFQMEIFTQTAGEQVILPLVDGGTYDFDVDWGDGTTPQTITSWDDPDNLHAYATAGTHTITLTIRTLKGFSYGHAFATDPYDTQAQKLFGITKWGNIQLHTDSGGPGRYFEGASNLQTIADSSTPNLAGMINMQKAFKNCYQLSDFDGIENWFNNTNGVLNMAEMFNNAASFDENINSWNVDTVTDMSRMFKEARAFNQNLDGWNVVNVTDMTGMFHDADAFNQNISGWNVTSVTSMRSMFENADSFNQDISVWDVGLVSSMYKMFYYASAFNQNLGNWNISSINPFNNMEWMMKYSGISDLNFGLTLKGWAENTVNPAPSGIRFYTYKSGPNIYDDPGCSTHQTIKDAYNYLDDIMNWQFFPKISACED